MVSDNETREDILEENTTKNTEANEGLPSVVSLNADNGGENLEEKTPDDIEQEAAADAVQSEQNQSEPLEQGDIEPSNNNTEALSDPSVDPENSPLDKPPQNPRISGTPTEAQLPQSGNGGFDNSEAQPENSPLEKGGLIAADSGNGGFDNSEAQPENSPFRAQAPSDSENPIEEYPDKDPETGTQVAVEGKEQRSDRGAHRSESDDKPEATVATRGLDFEEDLKMGVLESPEAQPEAQPETTDNIAVEEEEQDPTSDSQPELVLEDLEDYRESANIEEPEQLVDIDEFLELKRKADEARQKDGKKKKKKKDDIFVNRYKAKTINAAVAAADPIVYFYNAALDKTGKIRYFNVYQVLQDRFMGKVIPQQFTSVAEGSAKIEELNIANVIEQCKLCNEYPKYEFIVSISTRFFTRPNILEKLRKELKAEHNNLVLAFDCVSLQNIGTAAKTGLSILRLAGAKIMLDNTEAVSMTSLTELEYDYIRIDARYFEKGAERPLVYLELLSRFAASQGILTSSSFCDEGYLAEYMLTRGITAVQGDSVSRPMRTVPNAVKAVTLLPSMLD